MRVGCRPSLESGSLVRVDNVSLETDFNNYLVSDPMIVETRGSGGFSGFLWRMRPLSQRRPDGFQARADAGEPKAGYDRARPATSRSSDVPIEDATETI